MDPDSPSAAAYRVVLDLVGSFAAGAIVHAAQAVSDTSRELLCLFLSPRLILQFVHDVDQGAPCFLCIESYIGAGEQGFQILASRQLTQTLIELGSGRGDCARTGVDQG